MSRFIGIRQSLHGKRGLYPISCLSRKENVSLKPIHSDNAVGKVVTILSSIDFLSWPKISYYYYLKYSMYTHSLKLSRLTETVLTTQSSLN